jgi:hypothetical protein
VKNCNRSVHRARRHARDGPPANHRVIIALLFIALCSSPFPSTIGTRRLRASLHSLDPSAARLIQTSTLCHPREYPLVPQRSALSSLSRAASVQYLRNQGVRRYDWLTQHSDKRQHIVPEFAHFHSPISKNSMFAP